MSWRLVNRRALLLLHDESLAEHGGASGVRDDGLFDPALARPENLIAYGDEVDFAAVAAAYGFGLARNHPFVDGNKRAAFLAIGLFLQLNGYRLETTQQDATLTILALAAGELTEQQLAEWIRAKACRSS
ncbi:MAG: type II toxin-antitoxin system death-on-curing family toxin [Rhodocyclaceae bacterium]|nr:type II toxin-antitoxin system death-on-curing family toxin [Rhodocyclaceae bacterium]